MEKSSYQLQFYKREKNIKKHIERLTSSIQDSLCQFYVELYYFTDNNTYLPAINIFSISSNLVSILSQL